MFGRRKNPVGGASATAPPGSKEPFPIDKMDRALDGAIRLLTRALDEAGDDPGKLAIRGAVPVGVTQALAECTTYRGEVDGSLTYLVLGLTSDFEAFMYPPHCRLFMLINATGLAEDPLNAELRAEIARSQFKAPLIDAHMMRHWIQFILPTPDAMRGGTATLEAFSRRIRGDLARVVSAIPASWAKHIDVGDLMREWGGGFPGTIGRPLTPEVRRMNGLPVTPFIETTLTQFLVDLQMRGLRDR